MCLLTYFPPNAPVDTDRLACGAECNPHGHGYAIVTRDGDVLINHAMTPDRLIAEFAELRERHPDSEALFHSRITTHGSTNLANCHPFRVVGPRGGQTILAHNGILPSDCQPKGKDPRSDTRILAEGLLWDRWSRFKLPTMGRQKNPVTRQWLDSPAVRADIEKWLGRGSKVLVLTTNPRMKRRAYLLNESLGDWVDGVWYSNDSFQRWGTRWTSKRRKSSAYKTSYVWRNGEFQAVTSAEVSEPATSGMWWEEWPEVDGASERYYPSENGTFWMGRTWNPRQSYLHHFRDRACDVCDTHARISTHDYICDMCGVCWICNEYYVDCQDDSKGQNCGSDTAVRSPFDKSAGFTYRPTVKLSTETQLERIVGSLAASGKLAPSSVVKSAKDSAAVFVESSGVLFESGE